MSSHLPFDRAVKSLYDLFAEGIDSPDNREELQLVQSALAAILRAGFPALSEDSVVELVDEGLFAFFKAVKNGQVDRTRNPVRYLTQTCKNQTRSFLRRRSETLVGAADELDTEAAEDVEEDVLERLASQATLEFVLRELRAAGDQVGIEVLVAWRNLAGDLDRAPTSREVAVEAGVSHTTVQNGLRRARLLLGPDS